MLWIGEGDETKTPGSLSLPVLGNNHLRNRTEAAEVVFKSLLVGVEVESSHESFPSSEDIAVNLSTPNYAKELEEQLPAGAERLGRAIVFLFLFVSM